MSQIISTPLQYLHLWMTWKGGGMHLLLQEDLAVSSQLNRWCTYSIIFSTLLPGCFGLFSGSFSTQLYSFAERSRLHWVLTCPSDFLPLPCCCEQWCVWWSGIQSEWLPGTAGCSLGTAGVAGAPSKVLVQCLLGCTVITDCVCPLPMTNAGSDPGEIRSC